MSHKTEYYFILILIFIIITTLWEFFTSALVSRTLLGILADLNNSVVGMVTIRPLISQSSSSFINLLVTVPRAPVTIGIIVTFMFHSFSVP